MGLTFTVHVELRGPTTNQGTGHNRTSNPAGRHGDRRVLGFASAAASASSRWARATRSRCACIPRSRMSASACMPASSQKWIPGAYLETAGHAHAGGRRPEGELRHAARERHPGRPVLRPGRGQREHAPTAACRWKADGRPPGASVVDYDARMSRASSFSVSSTGHDRAAGTSVVGGYRRRPLPGSREQQPDPI